MATVLSRVMGALVLWLQYSACGGASREELRIIMERITLLQRRSGQLSSYKGLALQRALWPLDVERDPGAPTEPGIIGLYRIIGNPLPPRHDASQLQQNLGYILNNEPPLTAARKIFVLNRLNVSLAREVARQVRDAGHDVIAIPIDEADYRPLQMEDTYGLHPAEWAEFVTSKFTMLNANLYVMNNNGARNAALRHGIHRGWEWTLPFDGNCYFTTTQWDALLVELDDAKRRNQSYVAVPMVRTAVDSGTRPAKGPRRLDVAAAASRTEISSPERINAPALQQQYESPPGLVAGQPGEHQIAFARSARLIFDPTVPYGHRPKVALLWKLGVPGAWDQWNHDTIFRAEGACTYLSSKKIVRPPNVCRRTLPRVDVNAAAATKLSQAIVYRLPDLWPGQARNDSAVNCSAASKEGSDGRHIRMNCRELAIRLKIKEMDHYVKPSTHTARFFVKPVFFNIFSMESMRRECAVHKLETDGHASVVEGFGAKVRRLAPVAGVEHHHCNQIDELVRLAESRLTDREMTVVDKAWETRVPSAMFAAGALVNATINHYQNLGAFDWRVSELPADADVASVHPIGRHHHTTDEAGPDGAGGYNFRNKLRDLAQHLSGDDEFVRWEGHTRPDGRLWGPGSGAFDRTRSYEMMTNVTLFALAHFYTGDGRFSEKASRLLRVWFLNRRTRMLPTIAYSQYSRPVSIGIGLLQLKDLTYTFDALALVERSTAWSASDAIGMRQWCEEYRAEIAQRRERSMKNHHGLWYALQYVAVARCAMGNYSSERNGFHHIVATHVDRFLTDNFVRDDGLLTHETTRFGALQNHFQAAYGLVLAWRALQNFGDSDVAARLGEALRTIVSKIDAGLNVAPRICALPVYQRASSAHHSRLERLVIREACDLGQKLTTESFAPFCQWAFDYDPAMGHRLLTCRRTDSTESTTPRVSLNIPTPELVGFHWPPLLPLDPATEIFPFQNLLW